MKTASTLFTPRATLRVTCLLAAAMAALTGHCSASVLVYDTFDYTSGSNINGQSGGSGWSNNWLFSGGTSGGTGTIQNNALTAPSGYGYSTSSTSLALTPGTGNVNIRRGVTSSIDLNPSSTQTYYFSALFSRVDTTISGTEVISFLSLTNSSNAELVRFGSTSSNALNLLATATATGSTQVSVNSTSNAFSTGTTFALAPQYLVIGKMVLNSSGTADNFYFSIFPSSGSVSTTEPSWTLAMSADLSGTVTSFNLAGTANVGSVNFDNFYFGSDYASVIPEPSTNNLAIGFLAIGLAARLWRKRNVA